jgi:hypothetical protein
MDHLEIITEIARKLAPKFRFAYYDTEDIVQEGILLGLDALKRWDGIRPIENFLYTHIRNRLGTLKRDKYFRLDKGAPSKIQEDKKRLLDASDIGICQPHSSNSISYVDSIFSIIDERLPASLRGDYLRYRDGAKLTGARKAHIIRSLKLILEEYNGD